MVNIVGCAVVVAFIVTGNWNVTKASVIAAWIQKRAGKYDFKWEDKAYLAQKARENTSK